MMVLRHLIYTNTVYITFQCLFFYFILFSDIPEFLYNNDGKNRCHCQQKQCLEKPYKNYYQL